MQGREPGLGRAVSTPRGVVRLVAFGHALAPEERTDRVIAEKLDATFALTTARADEGTIARLRGAAPGALETTAPDATAAEFLLKAPEFRRAVRRVQGLAGHPNAEIRDNLLARDAGPAAG